MLLCSLVARGHESLLPDDLPQSGAEPATRQATVLSRPPPLPRGHCPHSAQTTDLNNSTVLIYFLFPSLGKQVIGLCISDAFPQLHVPISFLYYKVEMRTLFQLNKSGRVYHVCQVPQRECDP